MLSDTTRLVRSIRLSSKTTTLRPTLSQILNLIRWNRSSCAFQQRWNHTQCAGLIQILLSYLCGDWSATPSRPRLVHLDPGVLVGRIASNSCNHNSRNMSFYHTPLLPSLPIVRVPTNMRRINATGRQAGRWLAAACRISLCSLARTVSEFPPTLAFSRSSALSSLVNSNIAVCATWAPTPVWSCY